MDKKQYDIILKNLKIVDGTGAPAFYGDIAISDDTIIDVGKVTAKAKEEYDCQGLIAAPGFIDMHNHSDIRIMDEPYAKNYLYQGVTTLVVGNCGLSGAPINEKNVNMMVFAFGEADRLLKLDLKTFDGYLNILDKTKKSVNIAALVGHGNIRGAIMGDKNKKPSENQMKEMKEYVVAAMESGAFGLSTGLIYDPGVFASREEIVELTKIVAKYGGIYSTHIRNESDLMLDSVLEAIDVARKSGVRLQISHFKVSGKRNFRLTKTALELMEYYRRFGLDVTCDVYPCIFTNTGLENCMPPWTRENGREEFLEVIANKEKRIRIIDELSKNSVEWENILLDAGFDETILCNGENLDKYVGKSIFEISKLLGIDPYEAIFYILLKDPNATVIAGGICEDDVRYIMKHDLSMIGSDGVIFKLGEGVPHPRSYRAFTRVLSKYVRDDNVIPLERSIYKMTNLPASKLGLKDRGIIKPGFKADLAIFDLWEVKTKSNYGDPHHYSEGMKYVIVNGKICLKNGNVTGETPGIVLRKRN